MRSHTRTSLVIMRRLGAATCVALALMSAPAYAQTNLTWDVNGAAAGTGGTGTWNTTTPIWFNGTTFVPWTNGGTFGNAIFGGTAGTVTVSGTIDIHNITFNTAGYTITGGTLNLGGTTPTITGAGTIGSVIAGTAGMRTGGGNVTLILSGANTFTGPLTIAHGVTDPTFNTGTVILAPTASLATSAVTIGNTSFAGTAAVLQNQGNNQLPNATVTFNAVVNRWAIWQLLGTNQSVAGIVDSSSSGVLENTQTQGGFGNGTLTLTGTGNYSFNGFMRDNVGGSGTLGIVKTGTGAQTLSGGNIDYTGPTTVSGGTLVLSNTTAYRSATSVNSGATLTLAGNVNIDQPAGFSLALNNGATLIDTNSNWRTFNSSNVVINGTVAINVTNSGANNQLFIGGAATGLTGSGTINVTNTGTASTGVTFRGNDVGFSGTMNVSGGAVNIGTLPALGNAALVLQNTDLNLTSGARLNIGGAFAANATSASVKSLAGTSGTTVTLGGQTLTLGTNNGTGATFAGVISGTGGLVKTGSGTQALSGTNTYTGTTTINAGTLLVNGALSSGAVTVASGATLGGSGTIGGPTTVAAGATLAPGASSGATGALSTRAVTLNGTSVLAYELGAANVIGAQNDVTNITGNLTLDGTINVTDAGNFASMPGSYRLFNYTGTLTNNALIIGTTPGYGAGEAVVQTIVPRKVNLIVSSGMNVAFWDGPGLIDDSAIAGGTQTWNNTTSRWTNVEGNINQTWLNGMAIFEGTAGTVTLGASVQARALQFSTDGYQITGAGNSLTLLALPAGGASLIRVDPGVTATINATLLGTAGLQKADTGRLILSGTSSYTGSTTVTGGTLLVNGSITSSPVTTSAGTTLGGTGTIAGAVTIGANGTLAPGASIGTLTVGSLSLSSSSLLDYEFGTPSIVGGTTNDLVIVTGNLTLDGTLAVIDVGGFGLGVYTVMTYGGVLIDNGLELGTLPGGFGYQVQTGNGLVLLVVGALSAPSESDVLTDATVFWDGSATSANGMVDGGSGVWTASPTNWTRADGSVNGRWGGQFAVFQGAAGTVTVEGVVAVTGMQFRTTGYELVSGTGGTIQINQAQTNLRVDEGVTATIAAPITGSGGMVKLDPGTLILAGANSYTGGTTVLEGTLQGNATSLRGDIRNEASLVFDQRDDARFSGTLSGNGSLTKTGSGTLFLDGMYDVRGLTTVQAGTLALNGSLAGNVSVAPGGTLAARGSVGGSLTVSGTVSTTVAAGSDIAVPLNVSADVTLNPGGRYAVAVAADGRSSQIVAGGAAQVNGATIEVDPLSGQYGRVSHYGVLVASGGVTGRATATSSVSTFDAVATSTTSTLVVTLLRTDIPLASYSTTPNGAAFGGAIDRLRSTASGDLALVARELTALTDAELGRTLDAISGEIHASELQLIALDGEGVADLIREELAIRQLRGTNDRSLAAMGRSWGPAHRGWLRLQTQRADFDGGSAHGGRVNLTGVTGAFDWRRGAWLLGFGGAVAQGNLTLDGLASESDVTAPRGFGYVGYTGRGLSLHAGGAVAYASFETRRPIEFTARLPAQFGGVPLFGGINRTAIGESSGVAPEAWGEVRLAVPIASWQLNPSMGVRYAHYGRSAWQETEADALSLRAPDQAVHSTQADGGVRLGRAVGRVRPEFQARYRRELADGRTTAMLGLSEASSGGFVVEGLVFARDSVTARAGASLLWGGVGMSIAYEFGRASGLTRHALQLGVAFD